MKGILKVAEAMHKAGFRATSKMSKLLFPSGLWLLPNGNVIPTYVQGNGCEVFDDEFFSVVKFFTDGFPAYAKTHPKQYRSNLLVELSKLHKVEVESHDKEYEVRSKFNERGLHLDESE
jgi:hypothetical protein